MVVQLEADEAAGGRPRWVARIGVTGPGNEFEFISPGPRDAAPSCSPDGNSVVFVRASVEHGSEVWLHSLVDGNATRALTPGRDPSFSPDGQWIVYSRDTDRKATLWRIRTDGAGRTQLGRGAGADELRPAVSPDGSLVVYESVLLNRYRLFLRRFDGSGDSVLLSNGDGASAVW
jgi:TolB protein